MSNSISLAQTSTIIFHACNTRVVTVHERVTSLRDATTEKRGIRGEERRRGNRRMEMSLNLARASLIFRPVSLHCLPGEKRVFIARSSRETKANELPLRVSLSLSPFFPRFRQLARAIVCKPPAQSPTPRGFSVLMIPI